MTSGIREAAAATSMLGVAIVLIVIGARLSLDTDACPVVFAGTDGLSIVSLLAGGHVAFQGPIRIVEGASLGRSVRS